MQTMQSDGQELQYLQTCVCIFWTIDQGFCLKVKIYQEL